MIARRDFLLIITGLSVIGCGSTHPGPYGPVDPYAYRNRVQNRETESLTSGSGHATGDSPGEMRVSPEELMNQIRDSVTKAAEEGRKAGLEITTDDIQQSILEEYRIAVTALQEKKNIAVLNKPVPFKNAEEIYRGPPPRHSPLE